MLIPRIRLSPNAETLPVPLKRLQFPVRLAFAMTINKSQEQLVEHVGINLQTSVFSHGQLYVAFSRCTQAGACSSFHRGVNAGGTIFWSYLSIFGLTPLGPRLDALIR